MTVVQGKMAASKRSKLAGITNLTMIELEKSIAMFEDRLAEEELVPKSDNVFEKVQSVAAKMSFFKEFFLSKFCFWDFPSHIKRASSTLYSRHGDKHQRSSESPGEWDNF